MLQLVKIIVFVHFIDKNNSFCTDFDICGFGEDTDNPQLVISEKSSTPWKPCSIRTLIAQKISSFLFLGIKTIRLSISHLSLDCITEKGK
jgi:hypothetical protein